MRNMKLIVAILITAACSLFGSGFPEDTSFTPGVSYYGRNLYIEYIAGNAPVIISVPHGGAIKPSEIPDRTYGTTVTDANTEDLGRYYYDEYKLRTGKSPHIVICRLARIKLDCNRDSVEGAQGNQYALQAWQEYHYFLEYARRKVTTDFGRGFFIDLHGHGHTLQRIELGYNLSASDLSKSDATLNTSPYINKSSIKLLAQQSPHTFSELLRGEQSLGDLFTARGYPAVPSTSILNPGSDPYFEGGYNIERYGTKDGGVIDAVQFECNREGVRDTDGNLRLFAKAFDQVIKSFIEIHYPLLAVDESDSRKKALSAVQNFPNPFSGETMITYSVPESGTVLLKVFNMLGREVWSREFEDVSSGTHTVLFSGKELNLSSGIYVYTIYTSAGTLSKKMILVH